MRDNIKPRLLNKICAHPEMVSCVLSVCVFGTVSYPFWEDLLRNIPHNWQWMLYFWVLAVPAATLLTCFFGYLIFCIPIYEICYRINGAPLLPGDQIVILSGPHKGALTTVCEITLGQGGQELEVVDLGGERKDIFDEVKLLRTKRSEQHPKVDWDELTKSLGIERHKLRRMCDGPIKPGDQVLVVSGQHEGTIAVVSEIVLQQGWTVAILDLGAERKGSCNAQSLVKIQNSKQLAN